MKDSITLWRILRQLIYLNTNKEVVLRIYSRKKLVWSYLIILKANLRNALAEGPT